VKRKDGVITLCEIKYTDQPFVLDKAGALDIIKKKKIFKQKTRTTKDLFFAFISANGLKTNEYSVEFVSGCVTREDLFQQGS
jgi:uncharacterized protein